MEECALKEIRKDSVLEGIVKVNVYEVTHSGSKLPSTISTDYEASGHSLWHESGEVCLPREGSPASDEVNLELCAGLAEKVLIEKYPELYALTVSRAQIDLGSKRTEEGHPPRVTGILDMYVIVNCVA